MSSSYDDDNWVRSQEYAIQKCVVEAFKPVIDRLPAHDPRRVFLVSRHFISAQSTAANAGISAAARNVMDGASSASVALGDLAQKKGIHHFNRAVLGGPEGLFHMGHSPETLARLLEEHRKPDFVSQKAYDNSYRLGELVKTVQEAVVNNDFDAAMSLAFGSRYVQFLKSCKPSDDDTARDLD